MGHIAVVFGTLVALNFGVGFMVSDYLYEDEADGGIVEVQEVVSEPSVRAEGVSESAEAVVK